MSLNVVSCALAWGPNVAHRCQLRVDCVDEVLVDGRLHHRHDVIRWHFAKHIERRSHQQHGTDANKRIQTIKPIDLTMVRANR